MKNIHQRSLKEITDSIYNLVGQISSDQLLRLNRVLETMNLEARLDYEVIIKAQYENP